MTDIQRDPIKDLYPPISTIIDRNVIETELTQEEIEEINNNQESEEPTLEERINAIEEVILNLL